MDHKCVYPERVNQMGEDILFLKRKAENSSDKELAIAAEIYGIRKEVAELKRTVGSPGKPQSESPTGEIIPAEPSTGLYRVAADQTYHQIAIAQRLSELKSPQDIADILLQKHISDLDGRRWKRALFLALLPALFGSVGGIAALINAIAGALH